MKKSLLSVSAALLISLAGYSQSSSKLVSSKTQIKFFSTTPAEDIEANNTASVSTINKETGEVVFSVPMQSFEFDKALMQKHYNSEKYLDTQTHPKAKLKGKIVHPEQVNFNKDGTYPVEVEGELILKGVKKPVKIKGTISVIEGKVEAQSKFNITLADYDINFVKGKPSTSIAKTVEVTVNAIYEVE